MKLVNLVVSTLYRSLKNVVGEGVDALDRVPAVNISTILKLQSDSVSQIWHEKLQCTYQSNDRENVDPLVNLIAHFSMKLT